MSYKNLHIKKTIFFIAILYAAINLNAQNIFDANAQPRTVGHFTSIQVSNSFEVYITQGNEEALAVSASDPKYMEDIVTEVDGGMLKIYIKKNTFKINGNKKLKAYIAVKTINRIEASGACGIHLMGNIAAEDLKIKLSGASDISGMLEVRNLSLNLSGASDVKLKGTVESAKVESSGASDIKSYDLSINYCSLNVSGASDVYITIKKELEVTASGASSVKYKGEGRVTSSKVSGASDLKFVGS